METSEEVVVVTLDPKASPTDMTHELVHVIEGPGLLAFTVDLDQDQILLGPHTRLFGDEGPASLLISETLTDLIRVSLIPDLRRIPRGVIYRDGWRLLYALSAYGKHSIDPKLFIDAHMESPTERLMLDNESALFKLQQTLKSAFPDRNVIKDLLKLTGALQSVEQNLEIAAYAGILKERRKARSQIA